MPDRLFTTYQVADLLGATPGAVVEWIQKGWLPVQRLPDGPLRISEKGLVFFLKQRGVNIEKIMAKVVLRESQAAKVTQAERDALVGGKHQASARTIQDRGARSAAGETAEDWVLEELNRHDDTGEHPAITETTDAAIRSPSDDREIAAPMLTAAEAEPLETKDRQVQVTEAVPVAPPTSDESSAAHGPVDLPSPAETIEQPAGELPAPEAIDLVEDTPTVEEPSIAPPAELPQQPDEAPVPVEPGAAEEAVRVELPQPDEGVGSPAQVVEAILAHAMDRRASHVHLESAGEVCSLRLRADGVLVEFPASVARLSPQQAEELSEHLLSQAGLELSLPQPQNCSTTVTIQGRRIDLQLGACPTARGFRLVVTMPQAASSGLAQLALDRVAAGDLRRFLCRRDGMIALAGRTGPMRGEAIWPMTQAQDLRGRSVVAIDSLGKADPPGVTILQAGPGCGLSCAQAIDAVAHQDADVIFCQELPDPPAADAAIEACQAGKLLVVGVPSTTAGKAVVTLLELGMEPGLLASNLLAVLTFARVRILCPDCKEPAEADDEELLDLLGLEEDQRRLRTLRPVGCPRCFQSGYIGSAGLLGLMTIDGPVATAIRGGATVDKLADVAGRSGVKDLRAIGLEKVRAGLTSLEELSRVLNA